MMRAQVQRSFGDERAFAFEDVADPVPASGEVVVAVRACALNRLDLLQREAPLVRGFSLPHIAGLDVAGVVVARADDLAAGVGPAVGDAVLIDPVSTCGVCDRCTTGLSPYCETLRTLGSTRPGGFAEFVATPADRAYAIPDGHDVRRGLRAAGRRDDSVPRARCGQLRGRRDRVGERRRLGRVVCIAATAQGGGLHRDHYGGRPSKGATRACARVRPRHRLPGTVGRRDGARTHAWSGCAARGRPRRPGAVHRVGEVARDRRVGWCSVARPPAPRRCCP